MKKNAAPIAIRAAREAYSYRTDAAVPDFDDHAPIIVFDGMCAFCAHWVQFALRHDRRGRYRFIAGQSNLGRALYVHYGLDPDDFESNLLLEDGRAYFKADGTLRMMAGLGLPWSLARLFKLVPNALLEPAYEFVARHRMRLWGRRQTCFVPTPEHRSRFLA